MNTLRIQGREVEAQDGESLLEAARRHGFEIPTLCHHPALASYGACRVCLVEVTKRGRSKITAACTHPALPGLEVALDTERVARARRIALELLLAQAPEAPDVRALARRYGAGPDAPRFERAQEPIDCILCGLCERACRNVVGAAAVTISGRGDHRRVEAPFGRTDLCIGCGTCEAVCPAGTKTLRELREGALARFRKLQGEERLCRYALMGLLPAALCANDFRCERCETEQAMVDRAGSGEHPLMWAVLTGEREVQR